jgi:hypothetical protein
MTKLSDELRTAAAQLQGIIDAEVQTSEFDRCVLANFLTDAATRAMALEGIIIGDVAAGIHEARSRPRDPPIPRADIEALQAVLDTMAGHYGLAEWASGSRIVSEKLPTAIAELTRYRAMHDKG